MFSVEAWSTFCYVFSDRSLSFCSLLYIPLMSFSLIVLYFALASLYTLILSLILFDLHLQSMSLFSLIKSSLKDIELDMIRNCSVPVNPVFGGQDLAYWEWRIWALLFLVSNQISMSRTGSL